MKKFLRASLMFLPFVGCGPNVGSISAQIVTPLDGKMLHYGLRVVTLPRVLDLSQLKGERFIFKAGTNVSYNDYASSYENQETFEGARAGLARKMKLEGVSPKFSWNGEYYRSTDFDTLYMVTAYYWFERVNDFFLGTVGDTSSASNTPVVVSVYSAFTSNGLVKIPSAFTDNSAYQPLEDLFRMYRVGDQEGVPFVMNPGVIAHEFHHRVFHKLVFESKGKEGFELWKIISSPKASLKYARARLILRATDEAMSDIHAVAFSGNANFLAVSQSTEEPKSAEHLRDLDGAFAEVATYDNLADSSIDTVYGNVCHGESLNFANPHWRFYCLGTVIAKTLWEAAGHDAQILKELYLPALNRSFGALGDALLADFANYDLDVFWHVVLQQLPPGKKNALCSAIKPRFSSLAKRLVECP